MLYRVNKDIITEYTSPWVGFEFTTLVVIGTDCTGSYKSNYHDHVHKGPQQILIISFNANIILEVKNDIGLKTSKY